MLMQTIVDAMMDLVGFFSKLRARSKANSEAEKQARASTNAVTMHLEEFLHTRRGVEAFIELPTTMTKASILLVAHDGEWTRRQVPSPDWGREFAGFHELPCYDAGVVGYPNRMRDYNARIKTEGRPRPNP